MNTFEDFLTDCLARGASQVRLVPRIRDDGGIAFYAHPQGVDGDTFDGVVAGDTIINMEQPLAPPAPESYVTVEEADAILNPEPMPVMVEAADMGAREVPATE